MVKEKWLEQGFIDEPFKNEDISSENSAEKDEKAALKAAIRELCEQKQAVVMAHYYTTGDIQEVADFIGDSLALARQAAKTQAKIIVMCGVHFMAETCKLLSPEKMVLCPDLNAGCSLADSCKAEDLKKFKDEHPGYQVVSYVNTTAAVKAITDVVVTSGNAKKVIDSFPQDAKLIFGPDYNLGSYINSVTGRQMLLWEGGCHVHERFSVEEIIKLKNAHPKAVVMAHLECKGPVLAIADVKGSTADMLKYASQSSEKKFIVATEAGILHELQRQCPDKEFIPVPPEVSLEERNLEERGERREEREKISNSGVRGYEGTWVRGYEGTEVRGYEGTEVRGYEGTGVRGYEGTEVRGYEGTGVRGQHCDVQSCHCNECQYMKMNTLLKIYNSLKYEWPQVEVAPEIAKDAVKPIERMLELS